MKSAIRSPKLKIWPFVRFWLIKRPWPGPRPCCDIGFGPHMPRRPPRSPRFASLGNLFREARRASPQRQNNGACASDGTGLPWLSRKLRGRLFREARRASPQRQNNGARACDGAGLPWLSASKTPPLCIARKLVSGSPSGHPPAPKRRKRARGIWPSPGKLFREDRRASPQRQNNGARACDGAGLPWLSRKLRPSPGKLFREARRASSQRQNYGSERERRARSEAGVARHARQSYVGGGSAVPGASASV